MRILLLQDQVYLPTFGGGNKANRLLMEALASRGHECVALASAFTTRAGPGDRAELRRELASRAVAMETIRPGVHAFDFRGVRVNAIERPSSAAARHHLQRTIDTLRPDWILVSDDKRRMLLEAAVRADPARVVMVLQTVLHLPFGPHATRPSERQAALMARARGRITISEYLRSYLERHGGLDAHVLHLPVYGAGPFVARDPGAPGRVTMINPCVEKGVDIFLALAARWPDVAFAAVPTWGADEASLRSLAAMPNVQIRPPADDIDEILRDTSVLVVPSIWPEAFGYVVVEAMVRGIPVLASDRGGLPEAKLGVDHVLPVRPAVWRGGAYTSPPQDIEPWSAALRELLTDEKAYRACADASRRAALAFVATAHVGAFEAYLRSLDREAAAASRHDPRSDRALS